MDGIVLKILYNERNIFVALIRLAIVSEPQHSVNNSVYLVNRDFSLICMYAWMNVYLLIYVNFDIFFYILQYNVRIILCLLIT